MSMFDVKKLRQDVLTCDTHTHTHTTHVVMYCLRELVLHVIFLLAMAIFCDRVGSNRLSLATFRMEWSDLVVPGRATSFCRLVLNASSNSEKSSSFRMVSSSSWVKTVPAICVGGMLTQFNNGSRYLVSIFLFIGWSTGKERWRCSHYSSSMLARWNQHSC